MAKHRTSTHLYYHPIAVCVHTMCIVAPSVCVCVCVCVFLVCVCVCVWNGQKLYPPLTFIGASLSEPHIDVKAAIFSIMYVY